MQKTRFIQPTKAILLCLTLLLLASSAALASDIISFIGFEKGMKEYEKTAHWKPVYAVTSSISTDVTIPEAGCECTVTTRYLELFDSQETSTLKQWASFEFTIEDRACQGDGTQEQCGNYIRFQPRSSQSVAKNNLMPIFRYYLPDTAEEIYSDDHPDFEDILKQANTFWEKYVYK